MDYKNIICEEMEEIAFVTLNRPEKRNALSLDLLRELSTCLRKVGQERKVKVVIIRGGRDDFCAGHDLNEILNKGLDDIRNLFQTCLDLMALIHRTPQPVIAQVRGIATAAGCQLVAACDLAVAEEGARFATPGVKIGLFCSTPMVPLSRAVGRKKAFEILLTGEFISAQEAKEYGLVNRVIPKERLEEETRVLAKDIAQYSLNILNLGKQAFYQQIEMAEMQAYQYAKEVISANALMPDALEGMSSFLNRHSPVLTEK
ncbi:MAG: enoyl-CoA hydratase [Deltaproteobacteria bacterium]|nr:enoyl-CoA hydratase [Deltaproteobacteria bacterium]